MTESEQKDLQTEDKEITPLRCFTGGGISGALAVGAYLLTKSVIQTYMDLPITFDNPMTVRIASTVRTLMMGITTMATFVFVMVTVGLTALGIQLIIKSQRIN